MTKRWHIKLKMWKLRLSVLYSWLFTNLIVSNLIKALRNLHRISRYLIYKKKKGKKA